MLLEETSRNPLNDGISYIFDELQNSGFIFFSGSLDGLEEEFDEWFKRVLIHVVDNAERNAQEVQHSTFSSDRPIQLSLGVDNYFCLFSLLWLLLNGNCSSFGLLQVRNELFVIEDRIGIGLWKFFQEWRLKIVQDDLELVLFLDELLFLDLKFVFLNVDDHSQQLFLQARFCDDEVDDCTLGSNFRPEMGVY